MLHKNYIIIEDKSKSLMDFLMSLLSWKAKLLKGLLMSVGPFTFASSHILLGRPQFVYNRSDCYALMPYRMQQIP